MKDQFLTYEYAKMLKELGFQERCFAVIDDGGMVYRGDRPANRAGEHITAPLYQQAEQWLWENHKIWIRLWRDLDSAPKNTFHELEFQILRLNDTDAEELSCSVLLELHFNNPIIAKQEGIRRAIEHLHRQIL